MIFHNYCKQFFGISNAYQLKHILKRFSKFASVGVICVFFNWTLNFVLLKFLSTPLFATYVMVYLISILLSYYLNSEYTYQSEKSLSKLFAYYKIYISAMFIGVALLHIYDHCLNFEDWVYPFMVTPITMLWNFFHASNLLAVPSELKKEHT